MIIKRRPFHLVRLDRYHKPTHATTNEPRICSGAFATWRLKCQAWNSGCALEAGLIGRRLRPPSFTCLTGLRASTDRFNRPRRRHSEDWMHELLPGFFREQVYFVFYYRRSSVSLVFLLKFSRTVGVSPTLPRNPLLSGFLAALQIQSRVTYIA